MSDLTGRAMRADDAVDLAAAAATVAYERGRADERERIRRVAKDRKAIYLGPGHPCDCDVSEEHRARHLVRDELPFADLLAGDVAASGTGHQDATEGGAS